MATAIDEESANHSELKGIIESLSNFFSCWFEGTTDSIRFLLLANGEDYGKPGFYENVSKIPFQSALVSKKNVYFNVATVTDQRGTKDATSEIPGLWQDLDGIDYLTGEKQRRARELVDKGEGKGKWESNPQTLTPEEFTELMGLIEEGKALALYALKKPLLQPTFIIDTGKGYQAYWKFREPVRLNGSNEFETIELLNKRLAALLGADHTGNVNRIFRVPYTRNVKLKEWSLKTGIIEAHPERQFDPEDFDEWLPASNPYQKTYEGEINISNMPTLIPDKFWNILKTNSKLKATWQGKRQDLNDNSGSGLDMSLACLLVKNGFSNGEIAKILRDAPYPKSSERTDDYLEHTIRKARSQTEEGEPKKEPVRKVSIAEVKDVFGKWLVLKDKNLIEVSLTTVVGNYYIDADPLWVNLVSPPSGAKTEILRALNGCKDIYFLSNLTKSTLISGQVSKHEMSLLPKLTNKVLVMKDFTTVLEMRAEDKAEILAQLREIYDGRYSKAFGTGKVFDWEGHMGLLAGVTQAIDDSTSVKSILGERFIFYRPVHDEDDRKETTRKAVDNTKQERIMRSELHEAMKAFLDQFQEMGGLLALPPDIKEKLVCLADITSRARSGVPRESSGNRDIKYVPDPELPPRLGKQFKLTACSLALIRNKPEVTEEEYKVIRKIALDTMPKQRALAIKALFADEWFTTREIAEKMRYPNTTALVLLSDLHALGIVDRKLRGGFNTEEGQSRAPYEWSINMNFCQNLKEAGITEDDFLTISVPE